MPGENFSADKGGGVMHRYGQPTSVIYNSIGVIKTPYVGKAPYQPVETGSGEFYLEIDEPYVEGLKGLDSFSYIYVLYFIDRVTGPARMTVTPPWSDGRAVGLFASRSPERPNPIGLSIVRLKKIIGNRVYTSGLDVFDNTPLLDIKPYIKDLDSKPDADYGWVEDADENQHLALHIQGIPHEH